MPILRFPTGLTAVHATIQWKQSSSTKECSVTALVIFVGLLSAAKAIALKIKHGITAYLMCVIGLGAGSDRTKMR